MASKSTKIGLVQSTVGKNLEQNLKLAGRQITKAAKQGAKIICLQELFQTLYFPQYRKQDSDKFADTIPGKTTDFLIPLAKKLGVILIAPFFEKSKSGKFFNSVVVINEKGKILPIYHKIHIPQDPRFYEKDYFAPGDFGYRIYKTRFGTFAVLICYDQWFPEAARMCALAGAQIIFYPTAIGTIVGKKNLDGDWHDAWETVQRGHAIANSIYIAAVNRVGLEDRMQFWGSSFVSDPFGKVLKRASKSKAEVLITDLDFSKIKFIRKGWGFFQNRRPDTYKL